MLAMPTWPRPFRRFYKTCARRRADRCSHRLVKTQAHRVLAFDAERAPQVTELQGTTSMSLGAASLLLLLLMANLASQQRCVTSVSVVLTHPFFTRIHTRCQGERLRLQEVSVRNLWRRLQHVAQTTKKTNKRRLTQQRPEGRVCDQASQDKESTVAASQRHRRDADC